MRAALAAALLVALLAGLGVLLFHRAHPYALAEVEAGGGVRLRLVEGPFDDEASCQAALAALVEPVTASCPACKTTPGCPAAIDPALADALASRPAAQPYVRVGPLRELVETAGAPAAALCKAIAAELARSGRDGTCVLPP